MEEFIQNQIQPNFNYWVYVIILMIGLWGLIAKRNLIKKLIGMSIFQTAIILLYVSLGTKDGATIPIVDHSPGAHAAHAEKGHSDGHAEHDHKKDDHSHGDHHEAHKKPAADDFDNPLPHVLMLTAIVVGVSTLGVALAIAQSIYKDFGTLEEHEIIEQIKTGDYHD